MKLKPAVDKNKNNVSDGNGITYRTTVGSQSVNFLWSSVWKCRMLKSKPITPNTGSFTVWILVLKQ